MGFFNLLFFTFQQIISLCLEYCILTFLQIFDVINYIFDNVVYLRQIHYFVIVENTQKKITEQLADLETKQKVCDESSTELVAIKV